MKARLAKLTGIEAEDAGIFETAGEIIKAGGLVAFPTETVYGLGANALDAEASRKIYAAKGRPSDNPLIVHIADLKDIYEAASSVPDKALKLAEKLWPGPLTIILEKSAMIPLETTGGLSTVAVRFPSDKTAQRFIKAAGGFIAAPSANISGRPSPTKAEHVCEDLGERIDMIIDGGDTVIGLESTIVDFTVEPPAVLRPGYYNGETIRSIIGEVITPDAHLDDESPDAPKAPGMKYRHYAPKAGMVIIDGDQKDVIPAINSLAREKMAAGKKTAVICCSDDAPEYEADIVYALGRADNEEEIAASLFDTLRRTDDDGAEFIISESFHTPKLGVAIMNRLEKAAGKNVIKV